MTDGNHAVRFPCAGVPGDGRDARLLGLYPQAQEGLWMQRVKVLGGRLTADQWLALAEAARDLTPGAPLHLTTRQDIELHDLRPARVPAVQRRLADAGLTGLGAGGDSLRNITVCPCSGVGADKPDLEPLAWRIRRLLEATDGILALPRKFKVSLSSCGRSCGQPYIHDLGFVAQGREGGWTFRVVAGGSLGPRPGTGMPLFDFLPPADVPPCAVAMIRLFAAHGDREHRGRARLRHVRERFGDERFAAMAREALVAVKAERPRPDVDLPPPQVSFCGQATLTFANGDVTPDQALAMGALARRDDLRVRIAPHHRVILFGRNPDAVTAALASQTVLARAARPQPSVVACPGKRWCTRALADTNALADRIRALPAGTFPCETMVCISGCPNGCAHTAVADIGLAGVRRGGQEAWNLLTDGGLGRDDRLACLTASLLSADGVLAWLLHHRSG